MENKISPEFTYHKEKKKRSARFGLHSYALLVRGISQTSEALRGITTAFDWLPTRT